MIGPQMATTAFGACGSGGQHGGRRQGERSVLGVMRRPYPPACGGARDCRSSGETGRVASDAGVRTHRLLQCVTISDRAKLVGGQRRTGTP